MKIFTDESGTFSLINTDSPSLVTSLICTEDMNDDIARFMASFEKRHNEGKEIKGYSLDYEQRLKVCQFIKKNHNSMKISVLVVSPKMVSLEQLIGFRELQCEVFTQNKKWYLKHGGETEAILAQYDKLIKMTHNPTRLNHNDYLQLYMLIQQLQRVLLFCMVYFIDSKYRRYFKDFKFIFDRKMPRNLSSMEKYYQNYVMPFLDGQSKIGALNMPTADVWGDDHPFIERFTRLVNGSLGIELNKVFGENCSFKDSREEAGLRLVDIISNTIYNYLIDPEKKGNYQCYKLLEHAIGAENNNPLVHIIFRNKKTYHYKEPK